MKKSIMRLIAISLIIFTFVPLLASCTVQRGYEGAPKGMRPLNEGDEGAILYIPYAWEVDNSTGVPTAFYSSRNRTSVSLMTIPKEKVGEMTAKDYFESQISSLTSGLKDFKFVKEKEEDKDYTTRMIAEQGAYIYTYTGKITDIEYKFRQAVLKNPTLGCVYVITFASTPDLFDRHIDTLKVVYDNFRLVNESIPMVDDTEVITPSTEGIKVPDGYKLISGNYVDYLMFVPEKWVTNMNTGMTAAHAPEKSNVTVNTMAFETKLLKIDEYWANFESDLTKTFGTITYENPETKFVDSALNGYPARAYTYKVTIDGTEYKYEQHILIKSGYVYLITFCAETPDFAQYKSDFDGIIKNFIFKD